MGGGGGGGGKGGGGREGGAGRGARGAAVLLAMPRGGCEPLCSPGAARFPPHTSGSAAPDNAVPRRARGRWRQRRRRQSPGLLCACARLLARSLARSLPHRRLTALTTASRQSRAGRSGSSAPREEAVGVVRLRRGRNYSSQHASRREGGSAAGGQPRCMLGVVVFLSAWVGAEEGAGHLARLVAIPNPEAGWSSVASCPSWRLSLVSLNLSEGG